jgi:hypothetical protein
LTDCLIGLEEFTPDRRGNREDAIYHTLLEFERLAMSVADVYIPLQLVENLLDEQAYSDRVHGIMSLLETRLWYRINNPNSPIPEQARKQLANMNLEDCFRHMTYTLELLLEERDNPTREDRLSQTIQVIVESAVLSTVRGKVSEGGGFPLRHR